MKITSLTLLLMLATAIRAQSSVSFDRTGQLIQPDTELLIKAQQATKDQRSDEATEYLTQAARYGSNQAKAELVLSHLAGKELTHALAWLMLLEEHNTTTETTTWQRMTEALKQQLTPNQFTTAQQQTQQLNNTYGPQATLKYRESWRQDLRFTGSRIAGHIPSNLTVIPVEDGRPGTLTINLTGQQIRQQLDAFVNAYQNDNQVKKQTLMALMKLLRNL